jgi:hypothetical protein
MLDINVASIKTSVRFVVSKEDIAEAKRAASDLKKAFEKIKDPKMNFKRMKENMRQAKRETEKANKKPLSLVATMNKKRQGQRKRPRETHSGVNVRS